MFTARYGLGAEIRVLTFRLERVILLLKMSYLATQTLLSASGT